MKGVETLESNNRRTFFGDFKKYLPLLQNLAGKDFKIKYRRSVLGIAWSILNPLLTMLVLTAVFGFIFGIDRYPGVSDFAVFYIVGASMWNFFAEATTGSMTSVLASASLIKKVYIPKYIFPLEKCLFALINFAFSLIAVAIVMAIRFQNIDPGITLVMLPLPIIYCLLFATGISLFLSAVCVYFNDIIHLYSVILTLWMYLTTLIYPLSMIEQKIGTDSALRFVVYFIKYNPMSIYLTIFRDVVMNNAWPSLEQHLWCLGYGIIALLIGVFTFKKLQKNFILNI